ncbi:hypothetical protein ACJQWK_03703 [Exserohilum turcicum]
MSWRRCLRLLDSSSRATCVRATSIFCTTACPLQTSPPLHKMSAVAEKGPADLGAAPLNFIYACSLCGASFADVYEGHNETVRGLSDGINPKQRLVTRLFLSNCCHVFCSSHLEGGGPPFHSEKERPKAPCPVCIKEKGDSAPQFLYSIRGFNKNEYDPLIPPAWFTAPPIRLDGSGKDMDALRFQYIALIRYCQNTYATRKPLQQALQESEKKLADIQTRASQEHAEFVRLQKENEQLRIQKEQFEAMKAEVQRLQALEQEVEQFRNLNINPRDLKTFVANKSAIRHYLKLVPMLMDQNEKMQQRLAQLGFAMALEPIPNFKGVDPSAFDSDEALPGRDSGDSGSALRKTASSHTVGRSAHASGRVGTTSSSPYAHRPIKRQRLESPLPRDMQIDRSPGRHAMQPPPKPISRMQSVRKMFPNLRKKFSSDRSTSVVEDVPRNDGDVQMYDERKWQGIDATQQRIDTGFRSETPYMSGALPAEQSSEVPAQTSPQLLTSMGINNNQSDFTFRASSCVKPYSHNHERHSTQLPSEPSYIRLMDGLTRDTGVELGLKDPRDNSNSNYLDDSRNNQVSRLYEGEPGLQGADRQERWNFGHPLMHQSPHGSSNYFDVFQQSPRSGTTIVNTNRSYNLSGAGGATPQPRRHARPGHQIENVFKSFRRLSVSKAKDGQAPDCMA